MESRAPTPPVESESDDLADCDLLAAECEEEMKDTSPVSGSNLMNLIYLQDRSINISYRNSMFSLSY